jgi:hypothetical protein
MCRISDKIRLCSCKTEGVERLKHYWVLQRPEKKEWHVLGTILPPTDLGEKIEKFNIDSLRRQLNEANCFDVELQHQEKDVLELHFTCNPSNNIGDSLVYAFVYRKGKWRKTSYDPFGNDLLTVQSGKILKPFANRLSSH